MPTALYLDEFASQVANYFGEIPFLVGSALDGKQWRDVDVRVMLSDEQYAAMGFGDPARTHTNGKWVALVLAFSALGKAMTGLPIDFQIQDTTLANKLHRGKRSAIGIVSLRIAKDDDPPATLTEGIDVQKQGGLETGTTPHQETLPQG